MTRTLPTALRTRSLDARRRCQQARELVANLHHDDEENAIYKYLMKRCAEFDRRITQQIHERTMFFAVEHVQRQEAKIRPLVENNEIVLTPYHFLAPAVYEEMEGLNDQRIIDILEGLLAPPDLLVLLRFDPQVAVRRAVQREPQKRRVLLSVWQERTRASVRALQEGCEGVQGVGLRSDRRRL